jgi:hypothetical protein
VIDQPPIAVVAVCQTPPCYHREHLARRRRWANRHPWLHAWNHVPAWGKAMLRRLGPGCETFGKSDAVGYSLRTDDSGGPHRGRYQFTDSAWLRTIPYLPTARLRRLAVRGPAYTASPREQDVRTFYFYPSHRGEWGCVA